MFYIIAAVLGVIGFFDNGFKGMLLFGAAPFGYKAISYIESNVLYITTLDNFFWWKLFLKPLASLFIGPFVAPFVIIRDVYLMYSNKSQSAPVEAIDKQDVQ